MKLQKLSEAVQGLNNAQRSDQFVRQFRNAVRDEIFDAAEIEGRFELPKEYSRRSSGDTYKRQAKEMIFELTPAYEKWYEEVTQELNTSKRQKRIKPTLEAYASGSLDFKTAAAATREKMKASEQKGKKLGSSRKKK
ncbi:hypothetical protein [Deinococcus roseus]|uniref:Uncharacterized protein n=1 Tax=Deinococcus roseus TaxID=392414 RepID=A0ABQ2CYG8_9DEIO|nr:hypothetical protein [Deinococcus roseus]GGJ29121.1 hypothetical protein GCM10008938_14060 [Deinococcus roseus]